MSAGCILEEELRYRLKKLEGTDAGVFERAESGDVKFRDASHQRVVTLALPYLPLNKWLGFSPLPASFILVFAGITAGYLIASEITKKFFYRRAHYELLKSSRIS